MQHALTSLAGQALQLCPGSSVRRFARLITQIFDRHLGKSGLTLSQFNVLTAILLLEEEATAAEIARQIDADRSTLSRELGLLESRGLVETRQVSGRRRVLKLTEQGETVYRAAWEHWQSATEEVDTIYGAERIADTHRLLTNLLAVYHTSKEETANRPIS